MSKATKLSDYKTGVIIAMNPIVMSPVIHSSQALIKCPNCERKDVATITTLKEEGKEEEFDGPKYCRYCGGSLLKEDER